MTVPHINEIFAQNVNISNDTLMFDLMKTPFNLNQELPGVGVLAYLIENARATQSNDPAALFTVGLAAPVVVARGNAQKSRYRYTIDFYADAPELDPTVLPTSDFVDVEGV